MTLKIDIELRKIIIVDDKKRTEQLCLSETKV